MRTSFLCIVLLLSPAVRAAEPGAEQVEFFEKKIRPLLSEQCFRCHGEQKQQGGLRLDHAVGFKKGSDQGPVVVAGKPDQSPLIRAIRRQGDSPMPPNKPLPKEQVQLLEQWVQAGAYFPTSDVVTQVDRQKIASTHWAFQPVRPVTPPKAAKSQGGNEIDRFIDAKLIEARLSPAGPADRRTLIRRAYYDLIGMPPTFEEIQQFEQDRSANAFEKVIDRLLASPHYGERWARYWLDLARYSDTKGYDFQQDRNFPYAYTYRDYVIRSFNEDRPYDQFIMEQIAADRLPHQKDPRSLAAMGFLTLGRRFLNNVHDIIDDRIDVVTRSFLGLTVGCARCHDHKYDPIPIADYYSLYGIFASSEEPKELPQIGEVEKTEGYQEYLTQLGKLEEAVESLRTRLLEKRRTQIGAVMGVGAVAIETNRALNRADRDQITRLQRKVDAFKASSEYTPPRAMVLNDRSRPIEPVVFLRGNPGNRGSRVPRQMPAIAAGPKGQKPFTSGSGRLELAHAIASPDNPLTARVLVNRVWMHHFGQGLVRTPSDFGIRSDPPSHPELLDWLASTFIADDWSIKALHRRIMLSAAYQRASESRPDLNQADVENKLLARSSRRRLDFEALRDSILKAAGSLDLKEVGGRSADLFKPPFTNRRSVYGFVDRQNLPGTFRAFDFASPDQHAPLRFQTTVPQQALFLMNSRFIHEAAQSLVKRSEIAREKDPSKKLQALYRITLARNPTAEEITLAKEFLNAPEKSSSDASGTWEQLAQILLLSNEFAFVD